MLRTTTILLLLVSCIPFAFAHNNGNGRNNYTGSAASRITCTDCHNSFALNSGTGQLHVNNLPVGGYTPGQTYNLTITLQYTGQRAWGFQQTAVLASNHNAKAGHLTAVNANANVSAGSGTQLDFANHTLAGNFGGTANGPVTWYINWQAPVAGSGNVLFYTAGNAGNNNGNESGDYIYNRVDTVRELVVPQAPNTFSLLAPANGTSIASQPITFSWQTTGSPNSPDTISYKLFWSSDSLFGTMDSSGVITGGTTQLSNFNDGNRYFWRVRATSSHGGLNRLSTQTFAFDYSVPQPPTGQIDLVTPTDSSSINDPQVQFSWTGLSHPGGDAPTYTLWFKQGTDSSGLNYGSATSTEITLTAIMNFRWNEPLTWWVIGTTVSPATAVFSTQRFTILPTSSVSNREVSPTTISLAPAYPNPFNATTHLLLSLPHSAPVTATLYNMAGQAVGGYRWGVLSAGTHSLSFNGSQLASGVYLLRCRVGNETMLRSFTLLK